MAKVNLDALIAREDFEVEDNINSGKKKEAISIEDIKPDSFSQILESQTFNEKLTSGIIRKFVSL
jgi:hypothetical protein